MGSNLEFSIVVNTKTGEVALKQLDSTLKSTATTAKDTAKSIETSWLNAFSRMNVITSGANLLKSAFSGLLTDPMEFDQALKNMGSLSEDVVKNYDEISKTLKEYGKNLPVKSTTDLANAMYEAVSSGFEWRDALKLVEWSAKGSVAGLSTAKESMDALIAVMNAYNLKGKDSSMVMDKLFQTVLNGITTFPELASNMAAVAPVAANMGVSLNELMSTIVTITKFKVSTPETMTKINAAIAGIAAAKPGMIETKGLLQSMLDIYEETKGSYVEIMKLVGRKEAAEAIIMIGKNAQSARKDLQDMTNSAGAAGKAYQENASSLKNTLQIFENQVKSFKNTAITALLPALTELVKHLSRIMQVINAIPTPIKVLVSGLLLLKTAMIAINLTGIQPLLASFTTLSYSLMGKLTMQFPMLAKVAMTSATTFKAFSLVLSTTLVGAVVALLAYLPDLVNWFNSLDASAKLEKKLQEVNEEYDKLKEKIEQSISIKDTVNEYIALQEKAKTTDGLTAEERTRLAEITKKLGDTYPELIAGTDNATKSYILQSNAVDVLKNKISEAIVELGRLMEKQKEIIKEAEENIASKGSNLWNTLLSAMGFKAQAITSQAESVMKSYEIKGKAVSEAFKKYLDIIKMTGDQTTAKELVAKFQKQMGDIKIEANEWKKMEGEIIKVQTSITESTKPITKKLTIKDELEELLKQYQAIIDKDSEEAQKIRQTAKNKLQADLKAMKLTGEERKNFRKAFDLITTGGVTKSSVKKDTEVNLLEITNALYEIQEITLEEYLQRTNDLYDKLASDKKYQELRNKFFKGQLTPIEEKEYVEKSKELKKILDSQEKYSKEYSEANYKQYEYWNEQRKNEIAKSTETIRNEILKQKSEFEKVKDSFGAERISGADYLVSLKQIMNGITSIIDDGSVEAQNAIKRMQLGDLTSYEIEKMKKTLQESHPELAENLNLIAELFARHNEEMSKLQSQNLTSLKFWVDQASTILQIASAGLGEVLMSGFSKEGFEKMKNMLKEGFKTILLAIADALDKMFIGISLSTILEAIINPAKGIVNTGRLLAAKLGIEAFKGVVKAFSVGGIITQPTIALMGEKGAEVVAPKQDFITFARELIAMERKNIPRIYNSSIVKVELEPVVLKQRGRDLVGVIKQQNQIDDLRKF